ncbi:hypothetical protein ES319_D02G250400v1 [Gossypium barbadense]|uniref:Homeobox domain-containing protein n=1 Tax=Gossypium barbadense TaxID=3634 RepID=A0A5J5SNA3_GOSBA|nr:hypothetical protein ES319_D02G250400v1 [Gossypium barbadense]
MATYYTGSDNQRDTVPMIYMRESMPGLYAESPVLQGNTMMYMNSGSYSDAFAGNSQQQNNCIGMQGVEASDSTSQQHGIMSNLGGSHVVEHDFGAWRDASSILHNGQNLQGPQGLSLRLGTQIPFGIQMPSIPFRNPDSDLASFLSHNPSLTGGRNGSSRDEQPRNAGYLPHGFSGANQGTNKGDLYACGMSSMSRAIPNSKYLKAAQQLLDEVVNVPKALKQIDGEKNRMKSCKEGDERSKNVLSNQQESSNNIQKELSHAERQELQSKLTKLLSMLDEVDRRYKQYYHQMQIVVSSFDAIAGCGAAKPYTAVAQQTISRHFRCLKDTINGQIQATRKRVWITRLRYVEQQLRQQKALQQLGMMPQHAWRPQRGLPESSVSILRAWLFEHFLHPYPKDSEKIMLARQTGLTRSQVSNWFINARVRLWKPMIWKWTHSSSENAVKARKGNTRTSEDIGEDQQQSGSSSATERCSAGQLVDSKSNHVPDVDIAGTITTTVFQNVTRREAETEYGLLRLSEVQRPNVDNSNLFLDGITHSDGVGDRFMKATTTSYHVSELGRFGNASGVSLTLGLQHCEDGSIPMSGVGHQNFVAMTRDNDIYNPAASSIGPETTDSEYVTPGNRQHRFNSSHLLHDFVA